MEGRTFLRAVLKNHLLSPDTEAQVRWAAEVDLLPAGVRQVLGDREWWLAQLPKLDTREAELTRELKSKGQFLDFEGVVNQAVSHSQVHKCAA